MELKKDDSRTIQKPSFKYRIINKLCLLNGVRFFLYCLICLIFYFTDSDSSTSKPLLSKSPGKPYTDCILWVLNSISPQKQKTSYESMMFFVFVAGVMRSSYPEGVNPSLILTERTCLFRRYFWLTMEGQEDY